MKSKLIEFLCALAAATIFTILVVIMLHLFDKKEFKYADPVWAPINDGPFIIIRYNEWEDKEYYYRIITIESSERLLIIRSKNNNGITSVRLDKRAN